MPGSEAIELSNQNLSYTLRSSRGLTVERYSLSSGSSWLHERASSLFAVYAGGQRIDGQTDGVDIREVTEEQAGDGARHIVVRLDYPPRNLQIEDHTIVYQDTALLERWQTIRNAGSQTVRIERLDSISIDVRQDEYELLSYESAGTKEFESVRAPLEEEMILEVKTGRSSHGRHPWFALFRSNGEVLSASAMWSGNWIFRFEPVADGGYRISGGLHEWEFFKDLAPGQSMESAHVALVLGRDLDQVSIQYARVGRKHWYPTNAFSATVPAEWNHWWSYEDRDLNELAFKQNVDSAAELGIEICTLDAGWFGPSDPATHWYDYRGDWDMVNDARFPGGIRAVSDYVHARGMKFGLWCEIEALGERARLGETHPDFVALRSGERLGYVCFGNPMGQEWAFETLDRLITEYACDWIKLDFNLDPGPGCDRVDHGHGAGDGLYEHYQGYYRTLTRIRERHPAVILENCSSGGMRIDLGILRQTHLTFLSDPDWPEHSLQVFWGASTMLAPDVCLHWTWSEWISQHPYQTFNPRDPALEPHQLDCYTRIAMLHVFGLSQKLPELPGWVKERFAHHVALYRNEVRRFIRSADLYRLTDQPKREARGDRWVGFQYSLPDGSEHLLFVFRLHGAEQERTLHLCDLEDDRSYTVTWLGDERVEQRSGSELTTDGLTFNRLSEGESALILIR